MKSYDRPPRFTPAGVTTASILAVIFALGISVLVDYPGPGTPAQQAAATRIPLAHTA